MKMIKADSILRLRVFKELQCTKWPKSDQLSHLIDLMKTTIITTLKVIDQLLCLLTQATHFLLNSTFSNF